MKTIKEILAANLKDLRRARGFPTQESLAERAGIPFRTYQDIERGATWPQLANVSALAQALGVSESVLFQDPDAKLPPTRDEILAAIQVAFANREELETRQKPAPRQPETAEEFLELVLASKLDERSKDMIQGALDAEIRAKAGKPPKFPISSGVSSETEKAKKPNRA